MCTLTYEMSNLQFFMQYETSNSHLLHYSCLMLYSAKYFPTNYFTIFSNVVSDPCSVG